MAFNIVISKRCSYRLAGIVHRHGFIARMVLIRVHGVGLGGGFCSALAAVFHPE